MAELATDAASGQFLGLRSRQEDAMIAQFPEGGLPGLAVLSDGMGGHDDGDLASRILVSEMFAELYLAAARASSQGDPGFRTALDSANARLKQHIDAECISADTGGTLVALRVDAAGLRWLSVGDSPLYLFRDGALRRLNVLHSMGAQLDLMSERGAITPEAARTHPHRHCLTSAVTGQSVPLVDCPAEALALEPGDIVLLASDGLNVLDEGEIAQILRRRPATESAALTRALLAAVEAKKADQQDNVSLVVIRMLLCPRTVLSRRARSFAVKWPRLGMDGLAGLVPLKRRAGL
ncbi:PP2C family protein-serine/threonine phosphatase [Mameliella alba]|uniref:Putative Serine/threonine protein phosphatase n=1 Tax=Mameliella alba TaxID=561184 RepID=A0A0B3SJT4_9RHOB|nr:protein phosphatase 2C domain-containing protein [Mameliella alba]KHQ50829.1 putative Serine/threonine protein phosphatase [Mameliella alba]